MARMDDRRENESPSAFPLYYSFHNNIFLIRRLSNEKIVVYKLHVRFFISKKNN